ncbi:MAG: hypothetical protein KBE22_00260 [Candidatus Accumulibacter sp.]|nr:hypothetical protein [Accumulibacter sp.]
MQFGTPFMQMEGEQIIGAEGESQESFGALAVSMAVAVVGEDLASYGTPEVINYDRSISASGAEHAAYGTPTAYNFSSFILYPSVPLQDLYGTPSVYNRTQHAQAVGFDPSVFGDPTTLNRNRYVDASGASHEALGTPYAWQFQQFAYVPGARHSEYGTPEVQYLDRAIVAAGSAFGDYGRPTAYNLRQTFSSPGSALSDYGRPTVYNLTKFIRHTGNATLVGGYPDVYNKKRSVFPDGVQAEEFGDALIRNKNILPTGIQLYPEFGWPSLINKNKHVKTFGARNTEFGTQFFRSNKFIVSGLKHTEFGYPAVQNFLTYARAIGQRQTDFGDTEVLNRNRKMWATHPLSLVLVDGAYKVLPSLREHFGEHRAAHTTITPVGEVETGFGDAFVAGSTQLINAYSFHDRLVGSGTQATYRDRYLAFAGYVDPDDPEAPTLIETIFGQASLAPIYIYPNGWASVSWPLLPTHQGYPWNTKVTLNQITDATFGLSGLLGVPFISYIPRYVHPDFEDPYTEWGNVPPEPGEEGDNTGVMQKFDQYPAMIGLDATLYDREDWDYRAITKVWARDFILPIEPVLSQFGTASAGHA